MRKFRNVQEEGGRFEAFSSRSQSQVSVSVVLPRRRRGLKRVGRRRSMSSTDAAKSLGIALDDLPPCFGSDLFDPSEETCSTLCRARTSCGSVRPKVKRSASGGKEKG